MATLSISERHCGRWVSRDPLGEAAGVNLYSYCLNNPVRFTDFFGLDLQEAVNGIWNAGPGDALTGKNLANQSLKDAANSGLPGQHNGAADAYRHCLWSCRMAREIGEKKAKDIGDQHENAGDRNGQPCKERQMDESNNQKGRDAAKDKSKSCEDKCMGLLKSGGLSGLGGKPLK